MTYRACIKSAGAAVAVTGEAMSFLGDGKWQVSEATRRLLSDVNPRIKVGVAYADAADYELSLLTGVVTFADNIPDDDASVKFVGSYLPTAHVAGANKYTFSGEAQTEEITSFADVDESLLANNQKPAKVYAVGPADVKATLESVINVDTALWLKAMIAGNDVLLEFVQDDGSQSVGWFQVVGDNRNSNQVVTRETVSFVLSGKLEHIDS